MWAVVCVGEVGREQQQLLLLWREGEGGGGREGIERDGMGCMPSPRPPRRGQAGRRPPKRLLWLLVVAHLFYEGKGGRGSGERLVNRRESLEGGNLRRSP